MSGPRRLKPLLALRVSAWLKPRPSEHLEIETTLPPAGFARAEETSKEAGFTLLELIVVMIIIGVLAAIAVPAFSHHLKVAREAVLKEDLHTMREAIDSYTVDKQKAPDSLDDLVRAGYLKVMPIDPTTHRSDTWTADRSDAYRSVDETSTGINDVHSGSQELSTEGSIYSTW